MTRAERTKWAFRWRKALEATTAYVCDESGHVVSYPDANNMVVFGVGTYRHWPAEWLASTWLDGAPIELLP